MTERAAPHRLSRNLPTALATTAGGAVGPTGVGVWLRTTPGATK